MPDRFTWDPADRLELVDPPEIPAHLVRIDADPDRWYEGIGETAWPTIRAHERFRQAQDAWSAEHGLGRQAFEQLLADRLRAERLAAGSGG